MPKAQSIQARVISGSSLPKYQRTHHVRFAVDEQSLTNFLESLHQQNPKLFSFSKEIELLKLRIDAKLESSAKKPPIVVDFKPLSGAQAKSVHAAYERYLAAVGNRGARASRFFDGSEENNIRLRLSRVRFDFYNAETGAKIDSMVVQVDVFGVVYVSVNEVKINALYVDLEILERPKDPSALAWVQKDLDDCFEELLEYIINALIDDRLMDRIRQLALPELDLLIDDKIEAHIADVSVQSDALFIAANVTCNTTVHSGVSARIDNLLSPPNTENAKPPKKGKAAVHRKKLTPAKFASGDGRLGVAVTELALNVLGDCLTPLTKEWKDGGDYKGIAYWKYEARLDILSAVVDLKPGTSVLSGHLRFQGKVCGRIKPLPWVCVGLSPPTASYRAEIRPKLSSDGKTVRLFVDLDYNSIDFDWGSGWPWPINKLIDWLLDHVVNLILAIVDIFTGEFEFDVLKLPPNWPGTQVPWNGKVASIQTDHSTLSAEIVIKRT